MNKRFPRVCAILPKVKRQITSKTLFALSTAAAAAQWWWWWWSLSIILYLLHAKGLRRRITGNPIPAVTRPGTPLTAAPET